MANVMAVVSKAIFDAQNRGAEVGDILEMDRYVSANKGLEPLRDGGDLYLVTVRPPDEELWLVAVLEAPKFRDGAWKSSKSTIAVTDLASVRDRLRFSNDKGLPTKSGTLGMSLQTPRVLTDGDVVLLRSALGGKTEPKKTAPKETEPKKTEPLSKNEALSKAEAAIERGDRVQALDALLEAWRARRAPEIAALIDVVSDDVSRSLRPIPVQDTSFVTEWTEVESQGRAIDLPRLIPGLYANPLGTVGDRIGSLIARGPDPRLGRALLRFVDEIPTTASSRFHVWVGIFAALPTMVDRSSEEEVNRYRRRKSEGGGFWPKYLAWLKKLELPEVVELDEATRARVATMTSRAKKLAAGPPPTIEQAAPLARANPTVVPHLAPDAALAAAAEAMRAERFDDALAHMLSAWDRTRDKALGDLIDAVTLSLHPKIEPAPSDQRAWLLREAQGRPSDVLYLLAGGCSHSERMQRYDRLLARPADPRIGRDLAIVADTPGKRVTANDYWGAQLDLLEKHGDAEALALVEGYSTDHTDAHSARHFPHHRPRTRQAQRVVDAFRARLAATVALGEARRRLGAIRDAMPKPPKHPEADLVASILAAPDDDAPRLVYADWLMERGDKYGEWISLQCALARDPDDRKLLARQKAMTKTRDNRAAIMGPLGAIGDDDPVFTRGMITSCDDDDLVPLDLEAGDHASPRAASRRTTGRSSPIRVSRPWSR